MNTKIAALLFCALVLTGCQNLNSVITSTQTGLGASVSENPSTGLYEARFGYFRNEFAFVPVPTNQPSTMPDVMMEIHIQNVFKGGSIYQRLAVGSNAVCQPGAVLLFAKSPDGTIDSTTAAAVLKTTNTADATVVSAKLPLAQAYQKASDKSPWNAVAKSLNYDSFAAFLTSTSTTTTDVTKMKEALSAAKVIE